VRDSCIAEKKTSHFFGFGYICSVSVMLVSLYCGEEVDRSGSSVPFWAR
jgi:hypothetical protein